LDEAKLPIVPIGQAAEFVSQPKQWADDVDRLGMLDPAGHMVRCAIDYSSAFQSRGPLTVLLLNVSAHRRPEQSELIDSRTQNPLFRVCHMNVNEKQSYKG